MKHRSGIQENDPSRTLSGRSFVGYDVTENADRTALSSAVVEDVCDKRKQCDFLSSGIGNADVEPSFPVDPSVRMGVCCRYEVWRQRNVS